MYSYNYVAITIKKNAIFSVKTAYGFFRSNSHQASSISVNENGFFSVIQTQANGTNACLSCRGAFTVSKGASVYLEANYQNSAPLVLFNTSSSSFKIDRPKSVIFYNKTYNCLFFGNTSTFNIDCGKIDYWSTSPTLISTGILENNPLYTWHKSDENDISLTKR